MIGKRSSMRRPMNRRGMSGKWNAMWHSSRVAEVRDRVLRPLVRFGQEHPVVEPRVDVAAQLLQVLVRLGEVLARGALALDEVGTASSRNPSTPRSSQYSTVRSISRRTSGLS